MWRTVIRAFLAIIVAQLALSCSNSREIRLDSINDIADKNIAVVMGTSHDHYICSTFKEATISRYEAATDMAISLIQGQVDAFLADGVESRLIVAEYPELVILEDKVYAEPFGVGFNDESLKNKFNSFLQTIKENGALQRLVLKWENNPDGAEMPNYEFKENAKTLRVATNPLFMPFEYIRDGEFVGIDIEIMSLFCQEVDMTPVFYNMPFGSLIASLVSKKVDAISSGITITPERQKQILFSDPYYESKASLVTLKKYVSPSHNKIIGVLMGTPQDILASKMFPNAQINRYDSGDEIVLALKEKVCNQMIIDNYRGDYYLKHNPEFYCISDSLSADSVAVASSLSNKALIEQFNTFLDVIEENGLLDSIANRWFNDPENTLMPPMGDGANGIIKVGTTGTEFPFSFIRDGNLAGLDIDILIRFANYLGKKPQFDLNNFGGMISAIITGKNDIAANDIFSTADRRERMSLSEPYLKYKSMLIEVQEVAIAKEPFTERIKKSFNNNIIQEKRYLLIIDGLKVTLIISLLSILIGTILGGIVCAMRMSKNVIVRMIAKVYIDILRGIPQVVLLMLMFYVVFSSVNISGVIVASITFALNFAAYVAEMFRTSIESISIGQKEAGIALGFSKLKTFLYIILPQAITRVLPVYKGEFISLVKMTSIVGYIAVQDLTKVGDIIRSRTFDAFFPLIFIAILYFVLAWLLTLLLNLVELKTTPKRGKE